MNNRPSLSPNGVLFPDTTLNPAGLQGLLKHFDRVTLCRPWFMGPVDMDDASASMLHVCRPPEELKPKQDLNRVVAQYQDWMRQHQGNGRGVFMETNHTGTATWEIRQALREMTRTGDPPNQVNPSLKWHLILHLAAAFEQSRSEADALLRRLQIQGSPVHTALEDPEDLPGPLADVSLSDPSIGVSDAHTHQVLEAWLGLFGAQIPVQDPLVTPHRHVFEYAATLFEAGRTPLDKINPKRDPLLQEGRQIQRLPVLTETDPVRANPVAQGLSGRTLILIPRLSNNVLRSH